MGRQDAPGVSIQQFATPLGSGGANFAVPESLYQLDSSGAFQGVSSRGFVPAGPRLERSYGIHVAYGKPSGSPSTHTVTVRVCVGVDSSDISDATDAQSHNVSQISFNPEVADVAVTLGTLAVSDGATLQMIPFQRAALSVTPDGGRVYRTTPAEPKFVVDVDGGDLVAAAALGTDDVEVSRFHHFNPATGAFDSGIGPIHLPADLDVAVRRFVVQVVNTVPFRAPGQNGALDQNAAVMATAVPGNSAFILIPSHIAPVPFTTAVTGSPSPVTPAVTAVTAIPPEVQPFLRDGGALSVVFPADQPPDQSATVVVTIKVGPDAASAVPITAQLTLNANFTLDAAAGGPFRVSKGGSIVLQSSDGTNLVSDTTVPNVTVTASGAQITVAVAAAFVGTSLVVLVHDAAQPQRFARRTVTVV